MAGSGFEGEDDAAGPALVLDLRGLKCPLPVLRTRKALRAAPAETAVVVLCTDPMSTIDIPNLAREEGVAVEAGRSGPAWRFVLRRKA